MSDHHLAKGLSLSSVHDSGIHSLLIPETYSSSLPLFHSRFKTHLFKIAFPPLSQTVYPYFDSCYSHFMPYRMTPSVRHRAIEVHYYYYSPTTHASTLVAPSWSVVLLPGHDTHCIDAEVGWNAPTSQGLHGSQPECENWPGEQGPT